MGRGLTFIGQEPLDANNNPQSPGKSSLSFIGSGNSLNQAPPSKMFGERLTPENFEEFDFLVTSRMNPEEMRARRQTAGEKWANASVKMGGLALGTFLDGTVGTVVGIGNMAVGDEGGALDNFIHNPFSEAIHAYTEEMEKMFPNHYTRYEQESPWYQRLGTANLWADTIFKNFGFALGAYGSGMLTGGGMRALLGNKALQKNMAGRLAKNLGISEGEAIKKLAKGEITQPKLLEELAGDAYKLRRNKIATELTSSTMGAVGESRIEAISSYHETFDRIKREMPMITDAEADRQAKVASNMVFALDMATLSAGNYAQFKNAFSRGYNINENALNTIKRNAKTGLYEAADGAKLRTAKDIYKVLKNPVVEGLEEQQQFANQLAAEKYSELQNDPESRGALNDFIEASIHGMAESYGDPDNWENFFAGFVTGGVGMPRIDGKLGWEGGVYGGVSEARSARQSTDAAVEEINKYVSSPEYKNMYQMITRDMTLEEVKKASLAGGDKFNFKNAEHSQLVNMVTAFERAGKLQDLIKDVESMAQMDPQEYREKMMIDRNTLPEDIKATLPEGQEKYDQFWNRPNTPTGTKTKDSQPSLQEVLQHNSSRLVEQINRIARIKTDIETKASGRLPQSVMDNLVHMAATIENVDERIEQLRTTVGAVPLTLPLTADIEVTEAEIEAGVKALQKKDKDISNAKAREMVKAELEAKAKTNQATIPGTRYKSSQNVFDISQLNEGNEQMFIEAFNAYAKENPYEADKISQEVKDLVALSQRRREFVESYRSAFKDGKASKAEMERAAKQLADTQKIIDDKKLSFFTKGSIVTRKVTTQKKDPKGKPFGNKETKTETLKIVSVGKGKYKMVPSSFFIGDKKERRPDAKPATYKVGQNEKGEPVYKQTPDIKENASIEVTAEEILDPQFEYKVVYSADSNMEIDSREISMDPITKDTYRDESRLGKTERKLLQILRGNNEKTNSMGRLLNADKALKLIAKVLGENKYGIPNHNQVARIVSLFKKHHFQQIFTQHEILEFIDKVNEQIPNLYVAAELVDALRSRITFVRQQQERIIADYTYAIDEERKKFVRATKESATQVKRIRETQRRLKEIVKNTRKATLQGLVEVRDELQAKKKVLEAELARQEKALEGLMAKLEKIGERIAKLEQLRSKTKKDKSTMSLKNVLSDLEKTIDAMQSAGKTPDDILKGDPSFEDLKVLEAEIQDKVKMHKEHLEGGHRLIDSINKEIEAINRYIRKIREVIKANPEMADLHLDLIETQADRKAELRALRKAYQAQPRLVDGVISSLLLKYEAVTEAAAAKELQEILDLLSPARDAIETKHSAAKAKAKKSSKDTKDDVAKDKKKTKVEEQFGYGSFVSSGDGTLSFDPSTSAKRSPKMFLGGTAGSDRPNDQPNSNPSQRRWYRYLEHVGVRPGVHKLRLFMADVIKDKLTEADREGLEPNTIIAVLVDEDGKFLNANTADGPTDKFDSSTSIYTTLPEARKESKEYGFKYYHPHEMTPEQLEREYPKKPDGSAFRSLEERLNYAQAQIEEHVLDYAEYHKKLEASIRGGETVTLDVTGVSKGVEPKEASTAMNPRDFFKDSSLDDLEVKVSTTGYVRVGTDEHGKGGYEVKVPKGYTYVWDKKTGNHTTLQPRVLNSSEIDTVVNILSTLAKRFRYDPKVDKVEPFNKSDAYLENASGVKINVNDHSLFSVLNSLVFWTHSNNLHPKDKTPINENEATKFHFVDKSGMPGGEIQMGSVTMPLLDIDALDLDGTPTINPKLVSHLRESFLPNIHRQINSFKLLNDKEQLHIHGVDSEGRVTDGETTTYKDYILNSESKDPVVTVNLPIVETPQTAEEFQDESITPVFANKYVMYNVPHRDQSGNQAAETPKPKTPEPPGDPTPTRDPNEPISFEEMLARHPHAVQLGKSKPKPKPKPDEGGDTSSGGLFDSQQFPEDLDRRATGEVKNPEDAKTSEAWFKKRFPNVDYKVVSDLINGRAWGSFNNAVVTIMDGAEAGTTYHEAFHVAFNHFLTKQEQEDLYAEVEARDGINEALAKYDGIYGESSRKGKIEELLADEFMEYELSGGQIEIPQPKQKSFFARLLDLITGIFRSPATVKQVFERINKGYYAGRPFVQDYKGSDKDRRINDKAEAWVDNLMKVVDVYFLEYMNREKNLNRFDRMTRGHDDPRLINLAYEHTFKQLQERLNTNQEVLDRFVSETDTKYKIAGKVRSLNPKEEADYNRRTAIIGSASEQQANLRWTIENFEENSQEEGFDRVRKSVRGVHSLEHLPRYNFDVVDMDAMKDEHAKDSGGNHWAKNAVTVSGKRSASNRMRMLLASLPNTHKADKNSPIIKGMVPKMENLPLVGNTKGDAYILTSNNRNQMVVWTVKESGSSWVTSNIKPAYRRLKINDLFGTPESVDFAATFSALANGLAGIRSLEEMRHRLEQLKPIVPGIESLVRKLKLREIMDGKPVNDSTAVLAAEFFQTFAKQNIKYKYSIQHGGRGALVLDASNETLERNVRLDWKNSQERNAQTKRLGKYYSTDDAGNTTYNRDASLWKAFDLTTREGKFEFLEAVGVVIDPYVGKQLSDNGAVLGYDTLKTWRDRITGESKQSLMRNIFAKESRESGALERMIAEVVMFSPNIVENSHVNLEGSLVYDNTLNHYMAFIQSAINRTKHLDDLKREYPQFDAAFLENSKVLTPGGPLFYKDGSRNDVQLEMSVLEGAIAEDQSSRQPFSTLAPADKLRAIMDGSLAGNIVMLRPSDNSSERFINFGAPIISSSDIAMSRHTQPFVGYIKDELSFFNELFPGDGTGYQNAAALLDFQTAMDRSVLLSIVAKDKDTREALEARFNVDEVLLGESSVMFKDIEGFIKEYGNRVEALIAKHLEDTTKTHIKLAEENGLIAKIKDTDQYHNFGLDILGEGGIVSEDAVDAYMLQTVANFHASMIEQHKIFFGHPSFYKNIDNMLKRMSGAVGPKKTSLVDPSFNKLLQREVYAPLKRKGTIYKTYRNGILQETTLEEDPKAKPVLRTIVYDDVVVNSYMQEYAEQYLNMDEADAQGIIDLEEYKQLLVRNGQWTQDLEMLFRWEMAREANPNIDEVTYKWDGKRNTVTEEDLIDSNGKRIVFNPLKPQYYGPLAEQGFIPGMYKLSVYPLLPSMVKHKENGKTVTRRLSKLMHTMRANNAGIVVFKSGSKGENKGTFENGKVNGNKLYNSSGSFNDSPQLVQDTWYEYWGIQVDTGFSTKDKSANGTQLAKHVMANLVTHDMEGNVIHKPLTINGKENSTEEVMNKYKALNKARLEIGKRSVARKLGLQETGAGYIVNNPALLKATLKKELRKKNQPVSYIDAVDAVVDHINNSDMGVALHISRGTLEPVLLSIAESATIRGKRHGGAKIQAASTMFENMSDIRVSHEVTNPDGSTSTVYSSNKLKFYEKGKDGAKTSSMEVYMPHHFKGVLEGEIEVLTSVDDKGAEIIKYILNGPNGKKELDSRLFKLTGFRIPTSGLNSADSIIIKGFLPQSSGDMIVLPSEIVAKAGSDYDVDKLNLYIPNYKVIKEGDKVVDIKYVEYYTEQEVEENPHLEDVLYQRIRKDIIAENPDISDQLAELKVRNEKEIFNKGVISKGSILGRFKAKNKSAFQQMFGEFNELTEAEYKSAKSVDDLTSLAYELSLVKHFEEHLADFTNEEGSAEDAIKSFFLSAVVIEELVKPGDTIATAKEAAKARRKSMLDFQAKLYEKGSKGQSLVQKLKNVERLVSKIKKDHREREAALVDPYAKPIFNAMSIMEKNGSKALENLLNQTMDDIITAPENFDALIQPISTDYLEDIAKEMNKLRNVLSSNKFSDLLSMEYILEATERYLNGMMGVGISATQATNHILANQANWKISSTNNIEYTDIFHPRKKTKKGVLLSPPKLKTAINLSHHGKPGFSPSIHHTKTVAGEDIGDLFNQFINAYVDVATNPFIIDLHAGPDTASTIMLLIRAGVPAKKAFLFINQPIIRELMENRARHSKSVVSRVNPLLKKSRAEIVAELVEKYGDGDPRNRTFERDFEESELETFISGDNRQENRFKMAQVQILSDFLRYEQMASAMRDAASNASQDTSTSRSEGDMLVKSTGVRFVERQGFIQNYDRVFEEGSFLGPYKDTVDAIATMFRPIMPSQRIEGFKHWAEEVATVLWHKGMSKDNKISIMEKFSNDFIQFVATSTPFKLDTLRDEYGAPSQHPAMEFEIERLMKSSPGNVTLADKLLILQESGDPAIKDNKLLALLKPNIQKGGRLNNISLKAQSMDSSEVESFVNDWRGLLEIDGPIKKFAIDLAKLAILQDGFRKSPSSYTHLMPPELYFDILYNSTEAFFTTRDDAKRTEMMAKFAIKFFGAEYSDSNLVPTARPKSSTPDGPKSIRGQGAGLPFVKIYKMKKEFRTGPYKERIERQKRAVELGGTRALYESVPTMRYDLASKLGKISSALNEAKVKFPIKTSAISDGDKRIKVFTRELGELGLLEMGVPEEKVDREVPETPNVEDTSSTPDETKDNDVIKKKCP